MTVILMGLSGPDIFSTLRMKGQVMHRERARLFITYSIVNMKKSSKPFIDFATGQYGIPIFLFNIYSKSM